MHSQPNLLIGALAGVVVGLGGAAQAQLVTHDLTEVTPEDLVNTLIGPGVTVTNVQFSGADIAAGTISGGTGIIGFANGIVLGSGCISNVVAMGGLNNFSDMTCDNQQPGDPDLDALIPGYTTFDRSVLEFDFECTNLQVISFQYVFSSEEYNEYANTAYNDVFGFFVNGVNVALLPDNVTPVSINNVNCGNPVGDPTPHNCAYFMFIRTQSFTCTPPGTTGACCLPGGFCDDETAADCAEDGGVFHPDMDCEHFACTSCTGDIDGDGQVSITDLIGLLAAWGANPGHPADLNGDDTVDIQDLIILLAGWGPCA